MTRSTQKACRSAATAEGREDWNYQTPRRAVRNAEAALSLTDSVTKQSQRCSNQRILKHIRLAPSREVKYLKTLTVSTLPYS